MNKWQVIGVLLLVATFLLILHMEVSFKPFKVSGKNWFLATGVSFVYIGIMFIAHHWYIKGFDDALSEAVKVIKEHSKK